MRILNSFFKFKLILFSLKFFEILSYPDSKFNKNMNHLISNQSQNSPKKLSSEICNIKNCLVCENRNECVKCKDDFELHKKRCYSTSCSIYGFCKFCDEYDCLKCIKGYKLNYGICDQIEVSRKKFYFFIFIFSFSLFIIFIIYVCIRYKRLAKIRIATGQIIKFIHPKSGFYQLHYEVTNEGTDNSKNIIQMQNTEKILEKAKSPIVDRCVVCQNKNVYTIADCGCSICLLHYKKAKKYKNIKCKIHNVTISSNISFKMAERSKLKGNALERLGLQKCPICKINSGTQSFNCGCSMKVCEKCFNDNVYVFKYNQCPGCGKQYNPIKMTIRWNKNNSEMNVRNKNKQENGGKSNGQ